MEESTTPIPEETPEESLHTDEEVKGIDERRGKFKILYEHFGAKPGLERTDHMLEEIWEFAKGKSYEKDPDSVLREIKSISNKLGTPMIGEKPWLHLINYVRTYKRLNSE